MHITKELVEHLAKLALLELKPEEIDKYTKDLDSIIQYVEKLNKLNTKDVFPAYHAVPPTDVFREDEVKQSFQVEEFLAVTPSHEDRTIKVPKIIDV